jgi:hypothetical protein
MVGQAAFQAASCRLLSFAVGDLGVVVRPSSTAAHSYLGHRDQVQGVVELPVAAAGEVMTDSFGAGDLDRGDAGVAGEGGCGCESAAQGQQAASESDRPAPPRDARPPRQHPAEFIQVGGSQARSTRSERSERSNQARPRFAHRSSDHQQAPTDARRALFWLCSRGAPGSWCRRRSSRNALSHAFRPLRGRVSLIVPPITSGRLPTLAEQSETIIEFRGGLRYIRQRDAVYGSDRNGTAETAGPKGAS